MSTTIERLQKNQHGHPAIIAWFDDFDGPNPYGALSNFYEGAPFDIPAVGDVFFATGEHAFAALKTNNREDFFRIVNAPSPGEAKEIGRQIRLRSDWEMVKYDVMMGILRAKFQTHRVEGDILLGTEDALLVEGTFWDDRVWGISLPEGQDVYPFTSPGRNWLGTMLMARRAELRAENLYGYTLNTGGYNLLWSQYRR